MVYFGYGLYGRRPLLSTTYAGYKVNSLYGVTWPMAWMMHMTYGIRTLRTGYVAYTGHMADGVHAPRRPLQTAVWTAA